MRFSLFSYRKQIEELKEEVERLKKANAQGFEMVPTFHRDLFPERSGVLTWKQLWDIYRKSSAVRISVDMIVREIASLDREIVPKERVKRITRRLSRGIRDCEDFFEQPNANREPFETILKKICTDILVYGPGVIEKVKSKSRKKILEIYARKSSTFKIDKDKHGHLIGYQQLYQGKKVKFRPDEIIYISFTPVTYSIYPLPIIESIIDEVATLLFTNEYIASYFTEDSIPPGILNLGPIGEQAYQAAKQEFMAHRGRLSKQFIRVVRGSPNVQWLWLRRANAESQLDELRQSVERIIFRNFGIQPIEYGSSDPNRSTALIQFKISKAKMLYPLINTLNTYFTSDLLGDAGYNDLRFVLKKPVLEDEEQVSRADMRYIREGVMSINEVRKKRGLSPEKIEGGDKYTKQIGGQIVYVEDLNDPDKVRELLDRNRRVPAREVSEGNPPPGFNLDRGK